MNNLKKKLLCIICRVEITGYGNNPEPIYNNHKNARCCDLCDEEVVIPTRINIVRVMRLRTKQTKSI